MGDEALLARIAALEDRLGLLEDKAEIERLQHMYGYYIDNRLWDAMADLFAETGASIEIGRRGRYLGKARIRTFLHEVMGGGREGLEPGEIINHMQHQLVVTVDLDRRRAHARARAVVQASPPKDSTSGGAPLWAGDRMMWAEGVYENSYVKEDGVWKIESLWWAPTFYVWIPGYESVSHESGPPSEAVPPDEPSRPRDERIGRSFLPFHYRHPITGRTVELP